MNKFRGPRRGRIRVLTIVAVALGALLVSASPTQAATSWTMNDLRNDARHGIDIKSTTLSVGTPGYYKVAIRGYNFTRPRLNSVHVYFDTKRADPGPEYVVEWAPPGDGDGVAGIWFVRINRWSWQGDTELPCELAKRVNYDTDVVTIWVPRACLGRPAQVRWNAMTWDITEYDEDGWLLWGPWDAVPFGDRFGPWVA